MQLKCNVGIDLVYMPRYIDLVNDDKFLHKVLTNEEYRLLKELTNPRRQLEFLCGRYACKEAYSKALKLGIGKVDFKDIEILKNNEGVPYCTDDTIEVSISHDNDYAIAIVMVGVSNE